MISAESTGFGIGLDASVGERALVLIYALGCDRYSFSLKSFVRMLSEYKKASNRVNSSSISIKDSAEPNTKARARA